jgi:hypothetical protein
MVFTGADVTVLFLHIKVAQGQSDIGLAWIYKEKYQ